MTALWQNYFEIKTEYKTKGDIKDDGAAIQLQLEGVPLVKVI